MQLQEWAVHEWNLERQLEAIQGSLMPGMAA
jgi:hypothetical protein